MFYAVCFWGERRANRPGLPSSAGWKSMLKYHVCLAIWPFPFPCQGYNKDGEPTAALAQHPVSPCIRMLGGNLCPFKFLAKPRP